MVRKRSTYDFRSSISASAGSWDNYRSEVDVSGPLNDEPPLRGRIIGVLQKKDSFTDYINCDRQVLFGTLAYDFTPQPTDYRRYVAKNRHGSQSLRRANVNQLRQPGTATFDFSGCQLE
ncbi:hypothetical protein [Serratia symbiotica]|uniref:hypothetical protein n=1 Tax=Serratia symbiotica TaxID=138074 RepID=UPI00155A0708|nr:hypothetical protein [Serratia symbiotica]